ncbi:hypothetical protein [Mariniflexile sp. HMF6888]|uniref:hypothetical protein n=1 Tax=Mariniflexile sp. HMF6888 TaxID=3373086 RepID=UPI0037AC116B
MIKFLVIVQDLRVSGTSEGIVSRSFLAKLRKAYPDSVIDVLYLINYKRDDQLNLLPVNNIQTYVLNTEIPFFTKWANKIYWRLFHVSLKEHYIHKVYASYISKIDYEKYDHIFIRSSGLNYETILAAKNLPILEKAIINFHDPYPLFWYSGEDRVLSNLELFRLKAMTKVVSRAKKCITPSGLLSQEMQFLYGSKKPFYTLPHQFDETVFNLDDKSEIFQRNKKVIISYQGALQFGRNLEVLLDCYLELINSNTFYRDHTAFIMRLKSSELNRLKEKYSKCENMFFLEGVNFSNSMHEQKYFSDINILLENGPLCCNILLGKTPLLASIDKPTFTLSPKQSEIRNIIKKEEFIASYENKEEIKLKLENLIINRLNNESCVNPFGDYFSDGNFKKSIDNIIHSS